MSVNPYIEILKPNMESQKDKNLYIEWFYGIEWSYQIAVAGGKRIFQGVQNSNQDPRDAFSIYEQKISQSLQNYQTAIHACLLALELRIPSQAKQVYQELEELFVAQDWFQKACLKIPDGIVRLDWRESVWGGLNTKRLAAWDTPNDIFASFVQLAEDSTDVTTAKLSTKDFAKKYQEYRTGDRTSGIKITDVKK